MRDRAVVGVDSCVCRQGSPALLAILTENPANAADVTGMMRNGRTALHIAAERGDTAVLQWLVQQPGLAGVDCQDLMGRQTPAYLAVKNNKQQAARLLIGQYINNNSTDILIFIHFGAEHGASMLTTVAGQTLRELLAEKMPELDPDSVQIKVKPRQDSLQDLLYSAGRLLDRAQVNLVKGNSNSQSLVFFKTILQSICSTDPAVLDTHNTGGMTLLQKTADYGLAEFCGALLAAGADPTATLRDNTSQPVLLAAYSGHAQVGQATCQEKKTIR